MVAPAKWSGTPSVTVTAKSYTDKTIGDNYLFVSYAAGATVLGQAGRDKIVGGVGADALDGGADDDYLVGGAGGDALTGGLGNDILFGGAGTDKLYGNDGNDIFLIAAPETSSTEIISGGTGTDRIYFTSIDGSTLTLGLLTSGVEFIAMRSFLDLEAPDPEQTQLTTGNQNVVASAVAGRLSISGNAGDNVIAATAYGDTLLGGGGQDILVGLGGADLLFAGDTEGKVSALFGDEVDNATITLFTQLTGTTIPAQQLNLLGLVSQVATQVPGADTLNGGASSDALFGGRGDDRLFGNSGSDILFGGPGNDTLDGGSVSPGDIDIAAYLTAAAGVAINLDTGAATGEGTDRLIGIEGVLGSKFADTLSGGAGALAVLAGVDGKDTLTAGSADINVLIGGNDHDRLTGSARTDAIDLMIGDGTDELEGYLGRLDQVPGLDLDATQYQSALAAFSPILGKGLGNDTITGGAGTSLLFGGEGDDLVSSGTGALTFIAGGKGADTLTGGVGATVLEGDDGDDLLRGGAGFDIAFYQGAAAAVDATLGGTATGEGADSIDGAVDALVGGAFGDTLTGGAGELNVLVGLDGDDHLASGSATTSVLVGALGADVLTGSPQTGVTDVLIGDGVDELSPYLDRLAAFSGLDIDLSQYQSALDTFAPLLGEGGGNDTLTGGAGNNALFGGLGDDSLVAGEGELGFLAGGDGNDTLIGGIGISVLEGGAGDDVLVGGTGYDVAFYQVAAGPLTASLGGSASADGVGTDTIDAAVEVLVGGAYDDTVTGGTGSLNVLVGLDGNDRLTAGSATTTVLIGTGGDDRLVGSATAEVTQVLVGDGIDVLDDIPPLEGIPTFDLGDYDLTLVDSLLGDGAGADTIVGGSATNVVFGGGGDDWLSAGAGLQNFLSGGTGGDRLYSSSDSSSINYLSGGAGVDVLNGSAGISLLEGGAGDDTLNGGIGLDFAFYGFADGAVTGTINRSATAEGAGADSLSGLDGLIGSAHGDTLAVSGSVAAVSFLVGLDGNDTLSANNASLINFVCGDGVEDLAKAMATLPLISSYAGTVASIAPYLAGEDNGNDTLVGADVTFLTILSSDYLIGGGGNDSLSGKSGADYLYGGRGNDTLDGGNDGDLLDGGLGDDSMNGGSGTDTVSYDGITGDLTVSLASTAAQNTGGAGTDTIVNAENLTGGSGNDSMTGSGGNNAINGGVGNDSLDGGSGNDTLDGGAGNDRLLGGVGNDSLIGGEGNDVLVGSAGNDTMNGGNGVDTVSYEDIAAAVTVTLASSSSQNTVGAGSDRLSGIENLIGGSGNDTLTGDGNANAIGGGAGNDTISAGAGLDTLTGGAGADSMTGGADGDVFAFAVAADSSLVAPDTIADFVAGTDHIDVSGIDATPALADDQAFAFLGSTAFGAVAGELRWEIVGSDTFVYGDIDGDAVADFGVKLTGIPALTVADFVL